MEPGKNADVVFLDFAKVFNKVDHGFLLHKARDLGISGKLGVWLHSFLTDHTQTVAVDGVKSSDTKERGDVYHLQDDLNTVYAWANDSDMQFNEEKCEVLRYGTNQGIKDNTELHTDRGIKITPKTHVKCLGIHLSDDATFQLHIAHAETSEAWSCPKELHQAHQRDERSQLLGSPESTGSLLPTKEERYRAV
ncbi:uncharacterized protein LOC143017764 [Oratosquilla oratoria]|uniref:uncharacterized protein LOC143017764 n=1 Tax=Oratosquilla oratoria TaxID=337810 RepID=UPI003F75DCAE